MVNLAILAPERMPKIKSIATRPKSGEIRRITGVISKSFGAFSITFKPPAPEKRPVPIVDAVMEAIAIAPPALREKRRKIASCANTKPAIGALNPAEIAAATPQPIKIPGGSLLEVKFSSALAIVAPK